MRKSIVEEWRDIPKYCGLYQASNLGYIRNVIQSGAQRCIKGRTLSPSKAVIQLDLDGNFISE